MRTLKHLYEQIYSFENLHEAYLNARKCKRYRREVLEFTHNLEENLISIQNDLVWKTYSVGRYREFYVTEPKKRLVMALPFRDRVVQWAIYRILNPLLDKTYILDSYACRNGYGAHRAMHRVQYWMRKMDRATVPIFVLKMDVSKYFYRVDHDVLMSIIRRRIADDDLLWLLETIVRCSHTDFGLSLDDPAAERIPGIGMPIGNLTSQMFANLYLNELDQYCKHQLGVKYYMRYMDDVLILGSNPIDLREIWRLADEFLTIRLHLRLNGKTCIRSVAQGVEFCGFRIWPTKARLKKKTALRMRRAVKGIDMKLLRGESLREAAIAALRSYWGLATHISGDGLKSIVEDVMRKCLTTKSGT